MPLFAAKQAIRVAEKQLWGAVVESEKQNEYEGKKVSPSYLEELLPVQLRGGTRGLRQGLEGREEEDQETIRDEGNEQGKDHTEAVSDLRDERAEAPLLVEASFPSQHDIRLPRPEEPVPHHGPALWRRPSLPSRQAQTLQ